MRRHNCNAALNRVVSLKPQSLSMHSTYFWVVFMPGNKQQSAFQLTMLAQITLFSGGNYDRRKTDMPNKGDTALQSLITRLADLEANVTDS